MSKFSRGDIVLTESPKRRGQVITTWSQHISEKTGIPLVEVMMDPNNTIEYIEEGELELFADEYEFVAVVTDLEDWEQVQLGDWGSYGAAQNDAVYAVAEEDSEEYKNTHMISIRRRRKAGYSLGFETFRW